ncbi:hypothetical protein A9974_27215 [Achromobacter sp. UMC71]|nr:hypothetical protein [Achromobacter sp. UMC71]
MRRRYVRQAWVGGLWAMLLALSMETHADVSAAFNGRILETACKASAPSQDVLLGEHYKTAFTAIGKRVGITDFTVRLDCTRGPGTLGIYLEAARPDPVVAGAMALSPGSTAAGIVIQVMDGTGAPITWGAPIYVQAPAGAGSAFVSLKAAYYQKAAPNRIVAGSANGTATFTIVYR